MLNNEGGVILVLILLPTYTFAEIPFTLIKVLDGNFSFYGSEMIVKRMRDTRSLPLTFSQVSIVYQ